MDIEWGKDGRDGQIYLLQARPETVQSRTGNTLLRYRLKGHAKVLVRGRSIGQRIGAGPARIIASTAEMGQVRDGDVLVADMTDPDWEPVMKRASAIVTNRGGRTCHAAIIARELGIPAVVGCGDATRLHRGRRSGHGVLRRRRRGLWSTTASSTSNSSDIELANLPPLPVKIMMNVGNPDRAFDFCAACPITALVSRASSSSSTA